MTLYEYLSGYRDKRIAVVGLGVSNLPLIRLLREAGCSVTACDQRSRESLGETGDELEKMGCKLHLGEGYLADCDFDVVFRTPGMHPNKLSAFTEHGAVLTSEMEAFFAVCPCRIIAITGSDGKTTTSTVISELLKAEGYKVWLGGNIGTPLLEHAPEMKPSDMVVLELSSFQLHSMNCHPNVAVITNVSPNHLDVHPSYEDYINAKRNIYRRMTAEETLVLNADNEITRSFAENAPCRVRLFSRKERVAGVYCEDGIICRDGEALMPASAIRIPGWHNVENYMAAFAATEGLVSKENCRKVAESFPGVEHRLEMLPPRGGVEFCNDSIASSPTRTIAGLKALTVKPILIAGGYDKHIPFDELGNEICRSVKALVLTGATAELIYQAVLASPLYRKEELPIRRIDDFKEAVETAYEIAEEGDLVLLSPACASFDHFKNFAERGNCFRQIVSELSKRKK